MIDAVWETFNPRFFKPITACLICNIRMWRNSINDPINLFILKQTIEQDIVFFHFNIYNSITDFFDKYNSIIDLPGDSHQMVACHHFRELEVRL